MKNAAGDCIFSPGVVDKKIKSLSETQGREYFLTFHLNQSCPMMDYQFHKDKGWFWKHVADKTRKRSKVRVTKTKNRKRDRVEV